MKKFIPLIFLFLLTITSYAQNKTLGVGTPIPNPNAALHVESPTNNQGFIMPRLTTVQRLAMVLTTVDDGLTVYDRDLKAYYIWDGTSWGNDELILPSTFILNTADLSSATDALNITYNGNQPRTLLRLNFANAANDSISNPFVVTHAGQGAASVVTQSGTIGTGGIFSITNALNPNNALRGATNGTGIAGNFVINNSSSTAVALRSTTNGSGPGLYSTNSGTGNGFAGLFDNTIASNTYPAIQASTAGTGTGVRVIQNATSIGGGMDVIMQNTTGTAVGFSVDQQGLGNAGNFNINNAGSNSQSISASNSGLGAAANFYISNVLNNISTINANTDGTGNGGYFAINNAVSGAAGIFSTTNGTGAAIQGQTSTGFAAVYGRREGATNGNAGKFEISNAANTFPALQANTVGTGAAMSASNDGTGFGIYARAMGATDAIYSEKQASDGVGSAGNFWNFNSGNGASTVFAATNAATGTALGLINSADGNALTVYQGGLKISNLSVSTPGAITAKAGLYEISVAGNYDLPASGSVGEICWVANSSLGSVTINSGPTVLSATVRQFIRLTGGWQIVN